MRRDAEVEGDREHAYQRYLDLPASRARRDLLRGVLAERQAPGGGLIWHDEIFDTDASSPELALRRACSASSSIDCAADAYRPSAR